MKVRDLIAQLEELNKPDAEIVILGNVGNPEDEETDMYFDFAEIWNDGDESVTLFVGLKDEASETTLIKFTKVENRVDYLSVDKSKAISAHGEIFTVGDLVEHEDKNAGTATIQSFVFDFETNDVVANTEKGSARICFINKVNKENI